MSGCFVCLFVYRLIGIDRAVTFGSYDCGARRGTSGGASRRSTEVIASPITPLNCCHFFHVM